MAKGSVSGGRQSSIWLPDVQEFASEALLICRCNAGRGIRASVIDKKNAPVRESLCHNAIKRFSQEARCVVSGNNDVYRGHKSWMFSRAQRRVIGRQCTLLFLPLPGFGGIRFWIVSIARKWVAP